MKCPTCESCEYAQYCGATEIMRKCERHNKKVEQTNEDWFCGLDTEDKAREISDMTAQGYWEEELVYKWLKEKHK